MPELKKEGSNNKSWKCVQKWKRKDWDSSHQWIFTNLGLVLLEPLS